MMLRSKDLCRFCGPFLRSSINDIYGNVFISYGNLYRVLRIVYISYIKVSRLDINQITRIEDQSFKPFSLKGDSSNID